MAKNSAKKVSYLNGEKLKQILFFCAKAAIFAAGFESSPQLCGIFVFDKESDFSLCAPVVWYSCGVMCCVHVVWAEKK